MLAHALYLEGIKLKEGRCVEQKLIAIQSELKAPKSQYNGFGKYHYRNVEDILEALKPLLKEHKLVLTISDDIVQVGGRIYVKATALLEDGEKTVTATAYARESETRKGMDDSQLTGSTSSYARKYALNGLFLIDDTKDADGMDNKDQGQTPATKTPEQKIAGELGEQFLAHGITDSDAKELFIESVINKPQIATVLDAKRVLKALKDLADEEQDNEN